MRESSCGDQCVVEGAAAHSGLDRSMESIAQSPSVQRKPRLCEATLESLQNDSGPYTVPPRHATESRRRLEGDMSWQPNLVFDNRGAS